MCAFDVSVTNPRRRQSTHTHSHISTHTCTYALIQAHVNAHIKAYVQAHIHTHSRTPTSTHTPSHMQKLEGRTGFSRVEQLVYNNNYIIIYLREGYKIISSSNHPESLI